jgi:uncharacterized RDD family membrane protein YckC
VNTEPRTPYGGLVSRTLAFTLDAALLTAAVVVIGTVIGLALSLLVPGDTHLHVGVALVSVALGAWWLLVGAYLVAFWTLAAQTPGMRLMGLKVMTTAGRPLTLGRALVRVVGMVLAALPLMAGYAMILIDERRQGLHDKLARTWIVYVADAVASGPERLGDPRVGAPSAERRRAAPPETSGLL